MKIKFTAEKVETFEIYVNEEDYDIPEGKEEFAEWYFEFKQSILDGPGGFIKEYEGKPHNTEYNNVKLTIEE